jgi:Fe-S-cluster containining protein
MTSKGVTFVCKRCGKCCSNHIWMERGVLRGLTLLPDEIHEFQKGVVKPAIGIGESPHDKTFNVIIYQLTTIRCPNLDDNQCKNYKKRPLSCKQFPFSLLMDKNREYILGIDINCPEMRKIYENKNKKMILSREERQSAEKMLALQMKVVNESEKVWYFNLQTNNWIHYNELNYNETYCF